MATNNEVAVPLPEYTAHQTRLALPNTLMGGTPAMQAAGEKYLPREPAESTTAWKIRLGRTVLFNAIKRTVQKLTGEVFSKDVDVGDDVPEPIKGWLEDVNLQGRNESRFAQEVFQTAIKDGVTHILVDYPQADGVATLADEKAAALRPYWVHIKAEQVIGWRFVVVNGKRVLSQVRITESTEEPDGDYGMKEVNRIRVLNRDSFEIWEEQADDKGESEWVMIQEGALTLGFIPLVTIMFGECMSPMTACPPLEDLAYLNLAHWQSSSDQRNILHFARVPLLFGKGLTDDQGRPPGGEGSNFEVGVNRLIHSTNPEADLKVVEHSGKCIEAGRQDLKDLEDQMALFGLTLMLPKGVQTTATQSASDKSENDSALRGWAMILKDCLELALSYMAQWSKLGDKGGSVTVNTDFRAFSGVELQYLTQAMIAGKIPMGLWLNEAQRRGAVANDVDETEVLAMLENEARSGGFANLAGSLLTGRAAPSTSPAPSQAASPQT
jgi:hypothetical protein